MEREVQLKEQYAGNFNAMGDGATLANQTPSASGPLSPQPPAGNFSASLDPSGTLKIIPKGQSVASNLSDTAVDRFDYDAFSVIFKILKLFF